MEYRCNICGSVNPLQESRLGREEPDCGGCGSTVRMRSVVGLLLKELFEQPGPIEGMPVRRDIRGIGLSDWDEYARRLAERFNYTNTYYHQAPRLDITEIDDGIAGSCDFLISTDVFEHVVPPVSKAFQGARRLLRPGGVLILTVPYSLENDTREHFPALHDWKLQHDGREWVLRNLRADGTREEFHNLVFHGGPGSTLEMRVFSEKALLRELRDAGFSNVRVASEPMPEIGVIWPQKWSLPIVARA